MTDAVQKKLETFFQRYREKHYKKGDIIIHPEEAITSIFYLQKGAVRQFIVNFDGEELTFNVFHERSFFPIMLVLSQTKNSFFFQATADTVVYQTPAQDVLAFLKNEPDVLMDLTVRFAHGIDGLTKKIEGLLYQNAYNKVVAILLYLTKKYGKQEASYISLAFSHNEIATWIGLQRETVSRQLEKLQKKRIITNKNHMIQVTQIELLEKELQQAE